MVKKGSPKTMQEILDNIKKASPGQSPKKVPISKRLNRKKIILVAVALIVLMGLFPPWVDSLDIRTPRGSVDSKKPGGYSFILSPPTPTDKRHGGVRIDFGRLLLQWFLVAMVAGTLIYLAKDEETGPESG